MPDSAAKNGKSNKCDEPSRITLINEARLVLGGKSVSPKELIELAGKMNGLNEFRYARKLFGRALKLKDADFSKKERLKYSQKLALNTYKDPDLPADQKYTQALDILDKADKLDQSEDRETLGLAGAIYKRKWETEGGRENLERSYTFYRRGSKQKVKLSDSPYYTHINAAFVLDQLAELEEQSTNHQLLSSELANAKRELARSLREEICSQLTAAPRSTGDDQNNPEAAKSGSHYTPTEGEYKPDYWSLVTLAEAQFGLGRYGKATATLKLAATNYPEIPEWQVVSTAEQLIKLAQLIERREARDRERQKSKSKDETPAGATDAGATAAGADGGASESNSPEETRSRKCIKDFLLARGIANASAVLNNSYVGKIGLALSGGGFRASLFHIGVLAKLADLGILNRIEAISCVSGGSIVGAHYFLELCRLYGVDQKKDAEINQSDYLDIVKNLERDFLAGVEKNIRTRVIGDLIANVRMMLSPNYSRTMRVGELYEKHIYSRVRDVAKGGKRWLDELKIRPCGEASGFNPRRDNWKRQNKVPIMILNATSLNTGHVWQFTASYMGEPPASINTEIDAGYRLRRMYYKEAPCPYRDNEDAPQRIRLGHAVAASSCVPGMFEPISLPGLYPGKTVRLVDGGVFDNQGIASLLEQDCSVLLVSDASGQMVAEDNPKSGLLGVVQRSSSISQERIRWAQHRELVARKSSGRLKGLMFVHLKKDLGTDPQDWIDCPDPHDSTEDARPPELRGPLTRYGIRKDLQQLLSGVRTDLDSFSEGEAYALMASGYLMTEYQFADCQSLFPEIDDNKRLKRSCWFFLLYQETLNTPGYGERLKRLLTVSSSSAFKIWRLSSVLKWLTDWVLTLSTVVVAGTMLFYIREPEKIPTGLWKWTLASLTLGSGRWTFSVKLGWVLAIALTWFVARVFETRIMKIANWQNTLTRVVTAVAASTLGAAISWTHVLVFDKLYLWWGKTSRLIDVKKKKDD